MKRALTIWIYFIKTAIIRDAAFRGDFIGGLIAGAGWLIYMFAVAEILFLHTDSILGWSINDVRALIFAWSISHELFFAFFYRGLSQISTYVHTGDFDIYLVRPFSALWQIAVSRFRTPSIVNVLIQLILFVIFLVTTGYTASLWHLWLFFCLLIAAVVTHFAIMLVLQTTSFWFVHMDNVKYVFDGIIEMGRFPTTVFRSFEALVFTVIPLAYIGTTQTLVLSGQSVALMTLYTILGSAAALVASLLIYKMGIRFYASASS